MHRIRMDWIHIPTRFKVDATEGVTEAGRAGEAEREKESTRTGTRTLDHSVKSRVLYQLSYPRVFRREAGRG